MKLLNLARNSENTLKKQQTNKSQSNKKSDSTRY